VTPKSDDNRDDPVFLAAAGALASGVTADLRAPLRQIRDSLAVLVETLDRHFGDAKGPVPYPWAATKALRERLAETYLLSRTVARTTADLARAIATHRGAPETVDLNKLVEEAIALARPQLGEERDLAVDAGELPSVRLVPGDMVLLIAIVVGCAGGPAAAAGPSPSVAVRTWRERTGSGESDHAVIQVAGAGAAGAEAIQAHQAMARRVLDPVGGGLTAAAGPAGEPAIEIRVPVAR
jgi:hypothetical protein